MQVRLADLERAETSRPDRALVRRHRCGARRDSARRIVDHGRRCPKRTRTLLRRQRSCNECAGADTTLKISFREKLRVSIQHRQPRHAQLARKPTARWDEFSGAQLAPNDAVTEAIVDLLMERFSCAAIDAD